MLRYSNCTGESAFWIILLSNQHLFLSLSPSLSLSLFFTHFIFHQELRHHAILWAVVQIKATGLKRMLQEAQDVHTCLTRGLQLPRPCTCPSRSGRQRVKILPSKSSKLQTRATARMRSPRDCMDRDTRKKSTWSGHTPVLQARK